MRRDAAAFGDEFSLARVCEADAVQLFLAHRCGDDTSGGAGAGKADRDF